MKDASGSIEVDFFPEEIDSLDHWEVVHFKGVLEEVAEEYNCELISFDIDHGTISFSFSSEELMAEILGILSKNTILQKADVE